MKNKLIKYLFSKLRSIQSTLGVEPKIIIDASFMIGDSIALFPIYNSILKKWPHAKMIYLCQKYNASVFKYHINSQVFITKGKRNYIDKWKIIKKIKKRCGEIDIFIEPREPARLDRALMIYFASAKKNISLYGNEFDIFLKIPPHVLEKMNPHTSFPERYALMMESLGFPAVEANYGFIMSDDSYRMKTEYLHENKFDNYICMNLFGARKWKNFSFAKGKEIANSVSANIGIPIVLLSSPETYKIAAKIADNKNKIYSPKINDIHDAAAYVKDALIVFSPDTAIIHLASAFNVPTIGLYNALHKMEWAPKAEINVVMKFYKKEINSISEKEIIHNIRTLIKVNRH